MDTATKLDTEVLALRPVVTTGQCGLIISDPGPERPPKCVLCGKPEKDPSAMERYGEERISSESTVK